MALSNTLARRGRLPAGGDDAVAALRDAFQGNDLLQRFGPELTDIGSTIRRDGTNDTADVARLQSLLWAAGETDLKDIEGPTGLYSERHLETPLKNFQRAQGLKVDGMVKPDGPTIRKLGEVVRHRQDGPPPTILTADRPANAPLKREGTAVAQGDTKPKFSPQRKPAPPGQSTRRPLAGDTYRGTYLDAIAERESKSFQDVNRDPKTGEGRAWGRYQITRGALQDLGLMDAKGNWKFNPKYGIGSEHEFLENPVVQKQVIVDFLGLKESRLRGNGAFDFIGQRIEGKKATFSISPGALLAAAHREGATGVKQYLEWMKNHDWRSRGGSFPKESRDGFNAIEKRLREFEKVEYLN